MRFPSLETLLAFTLVGTSILALMGNTAQHSGYALLLAFNICVFLLIFRYGFGSWTLERHDPLGNVVGLVMMFTGASILVVWIAWTNDSEKLLMLGPYWGVAVGLAGGLVIFPGITHETLRRRIGPGASLPLLIQVLYSGDAELKRQAAAGVASFDLPAASDAVPPLLLLAEGTAAEELHAHAALASLGVPLENTAAVFERELKAAHFRAANSPLVKYPRGTLEFLREQLRSKSAFTQRRACEVVSAIGSAAEKARPELMALISERDRAVSQAASRAISSLSGPSIIRLFVRQWPRLLIIALLALALYGCSYTQLGRLHGLCLARDFGGARADGLLVEALGDPWMEIRSLADKALTKRGRAAEPALRAGLNSPSEEIRQRCEAILQNLPPQ